MGLWLSALGRPNWIVVWIFIMGTVLMRSAGWAHQRLRRPRFRHAGRATGGAR
jgi:hypothetical protein